jgi:hypothetical protein
MEINLGNRIFEFESNFGPVDEENISEGQLNAIKSRYSVSTAKALRIRKTLSAVSKDSKRVAKQLVQLFSNLTDENILLLMLTSSFDTIKSLEPQVADNYRTRSNGSFMALMAMCWGPILGIQSHDPYLFFGSVIASWGGTILFLGPWKEERQTRKANKVIDKILQPIKNEQKKWLQTSPNHHLDQEFEIAWRQWKLDISDYLENNSPSDSITISRRLEISGSLLRKINAWELPNGQAYTDYLTKEGVTNPVVFNDIKAGLERKLAQLKAVRNEAANNLKEAQIYLETFEKNKHLERSINDNNLFGTKYALANSIYEAAFANISLLDLQITKVVSLEALLVANYNDFDKAMIEMHRDQSSFISRISGWFRKFRR